MAFLAPTASIFSGFGLLAGGIQGIGQLIEGGQKKALYDQNAEVYAQQAEMARVRAALDETRGRKAANAQVGQNVTDFVSAGVNPYTGSPVEHTVESLSNAYLDVEIEKYNNLTLAQRYESEARNKRFEGAQTARETRFKAGMTLLQAAASYGQKRGIL